MRVLVCDDDPAARFVAKRWLTSALGCAVTDCEDGVQALELISSHPFDLALIDLELPRLHGIEVVEAIRANESTHDLPVVILSQERREDVVRKLVALGVSAYLLKPLRERTVLGRIGPLLSGRRVTRSHSAHSLAEVRLGPDTPALLVDGDQNFRHTFASVAGEYGPIMPAESGADAFALYRRSPVSLVFIGNGLGIMRAETLIRKIREMEPGPTRLVSVGTEAGSTLRALVDGAMNRSFVADSLHDELRPFVRVNGPLPVLEELAPGFAPCLSSAVVQVFGMMGGLDVVIAIDGAAEPGPSLVAAVSVEVGGRMELDLELVMPRPVAADISVRMLGCEPAEVDDEACIATMNELINMVSGRLDAWLKGRTLTSRVTLPETRAVDDGAVLETIGPGDGFSNRFLISDLSQHVALRGRARQPVRA